MMMMLNGAIFRGTIDFYFSSFILSLGFTHFLGLVWFARRQTDPPHCADKSFIPTISFRTPTKCFPILDQSHFLSDVS
jgi:hypothetical protein